MLYLKAMALSWVWQDHQRLDCSKICSLFTWKWSENWLLHLTSYKYSCRSVFNPLSPSNDKHLISPYNITTWSKHTGHKNKLNDHQRKNLLMFVQILPTSTIRNIWRTVRRICMFKRLIRYYCTRYSVSQGITCFHRVILIYTCFYMIHGQYVFTWDSLMIFLSHCDTTYFYCGVIVGI